MYNNKIIDLICAVMVCVLTTLAMMAGHHQDYAKGAYLYSNATAIMVIWLLIKQNS